MSAGARGALLGRGGTSEVFAFGPGRVLKLFFPRYAYAAPLEAARARAVHEGGLPVPAVLGEVGVDDRPGIVFERVDGPLLFRELAGDAAAIDGAGRTLADLHARLHRRRAAALPVLLDVLAAAGRDLSGAEAAAHERRVALLPVGDAACHGDMHPGNVILAARGPVVIDWVNAVRSHPAVDVARSLVLMRFGPGEAVSGTGGADSARVARIRELLVDAYLARTLELGHVTRDEVARAEPLCAAGVLRAVPDHPAREALSAIVRAADRAGA